MALEIEMLTVGPVAENCFLVRREGSERVLVVDPGEEAERILAKLEEFGGKPEAILITHCHFDHIGAVTPVAEATGAPVYCPEIEKPSSPTSWPSFPGRDLAPSRTTRPTRRSRAGRRWSSRGSRSTCSSPLGTARATSPTPSAERMRSSPATSSSRARSGGSTCPAATGRP